jgi:hypothetical protein
VKIDFTKLQKLFADQIKSECKMELKAHEIAFQVEPNFNFPNNSITIRILVFGQVFGHGYASKQSDEWDYLKDCFSRMHDYDCYDNAHQLIRLKCMSLEASYLYQCDKIKAYLSSYHFHQREIDIYFSDSDEGTTDSRGFPAFVMEIGFGTNQLNRKIEPWDYNYKLADEIINEIDKLLNQQNHE